MPKILLGIHNPDIVRSYREFFRVAGYEVDETSNPQDMLSMVDTGEHQSYLMDLNLGSPGSRDIEPARQVYGRVKDRVESGQAKFLGISGESQVVREAKVEGIPAANKGDFLLKDLLM